LAAVAGGFRELLAVRGSLDSSQVVRTLVPVSIRRPDERGNVDNQLSAVVVDLPVGEPSPRARLESVRRQMNARKRLLSAFEPRGVTSAVDLLPAPLIAVAAQALLRIEQPWVHAVTTNVPGPPVPLHTRWTIWSRQPSVWPDLFLRWSYSTRARPRLPADGPLTPDEEAPWSTTLRQISVTTPEPACLIPGSASCCSGGATRPGGFPARRDR
jgi:hypothetical protein